MQELRCTHKGSGANSARKTASAKESPAGTSGKKSISQRFKGISLFKKNKSKAASRAAAEPRRKGGLRVGKTG